MEEDLAKSSESPKKKTRPLKKKSTSAAVNEDSGLAGIVSSHGPSVLGHGNFEELVNLKIIIKRLIRLYLEPLDLGQRAVNSGSAGIVSSHGPSFVGHGKFEEFVNLKIIIKRLIRLYLEPLDLGQPAVDSAVSSLVIKFDGCDGEEVESRCVHITDPSNGVTQIIEIEQVPTRWTEQEFLQVLPEVLQTKCVCVDALFIDTFLN